MLKINNPERFQKAPRAIFFDFDNTFYPYDPAHAAAYSATQEKAARQLGLPAAAVKSAFDAARDHVKRRLGPVASSHSRLLYFSKGIELLGLRTQPLLALDLEQNYWNVFFQNIAIYPDVQQFLTAVRGAGITTCMVTDLTTQVQYRKLLYVGLETYFDYIVTSEDSGADKPAMASFEMALELAQTTPDVTWMIGDSRSSDIAGGAQAGLATLLKGKAGADCTPDMSFEHFAALHKFMKDKIWLPY